MTKKSPNEDMEIPTPFGKVHLQEPELPELKPPDMDERQMGAMKHAIASDIAGIIGMIPIVGDIVADVIEDLHSSEIKAALTDEEATEYSKQDKVAPSVIAMARTFTKVRR